MPTDLATILQSYGFTLNDVNRYVRDAIEIPVQSVTVPEAGSGAGTITGGSNVGSGQGEVFKAVSGSDLVFRKLYASGHSGSGGLEITTATNDITFKLRISGSKLSTQGIVEVFNPGTAGEYIGLSLASTAEAGAMAPADKVVVDAVAASGLQAAYDLGNVIQVAYGGSSPFRVKQSGGSPEDSSTIFEVTDLVDSPIFSVDPNAVIALQNLQAMAGLAVIGDITVTGTVDGVDVAALSSTVGSLGTTVSSLSATVSAHVASTSNPHSTTLQKAYTAGPKIDVDPGTAMVIAAVDPAQVILEIQDLSANVLVEFTDANVSFNVPIAMNAQEITGAGAIACTSLTSTGAISGTIGTFTGAVTAPSGSNLQIADADGHTTQTELEGAVNELFGVVENAVVLHGRRVGTLTAGSTVRFLQDSTDNFFRHPMPGNTTFVILAAYYRVLVGATNGDYITELGVRMYPDPDTTTGQTDVYVVGGTYTNSSGSPRWASFAAVGTLENPLGTLTANAGSPVDNGAGLMLIYRNDAGSVATLPSDDVFGYVMGVFI